MEVNNREARREVELANRLLRERERAHGREMDSLKDAHREQIDSLTKTQQDTIKRVNKQSEDDRIATRERFDTEAEKLTDHYQKSLEEERSEAYDRYGKLQAENMRARTKADEIASKQIEQIVDSYEYNKGLADAENRRRIDNLRGRFVEDKQQLEKDFSKKIDQGHDETQKALQKTRDLFRHDNSEAARRYAQAELKQRTHDEGRFRKLIEDTSAERERMATAAKQRETQLVNDKAFMANKMRLEAGKSSDEFRERASEMVNETIKTSNDEIGQVKRANAGKFVNQMQEHQAQLQSRDNAHRDQVTEMDFRNRIERDRNELQREVAEKRHKTDMALSANAVSDSNALNSEDMKLRYSQNLHNMDEKNKKRFSEYQQESQKKMYEENARSASDKNSLEREKAAALSQAQVQMRKMRQDMNNQFENRQTLMEDLHKRQAEDLKNATQEDMRYIREQADRSIQDKNLEHQTHSYRLRQEIQHRTEELDSQRKLELDSKDKQYNERTKRLTNLYNRTLIANKEAFDDEANAFKHESMLQLAKQRANADHEKRVQLMELLNKNRSQLVAMEGKFNAAKDEHEAELAKMRSENDKNMRDIMRRSREMLDSERTIHQRELDAKERQMKEKLRLQEEAFKDTIEKMKRSHDLALKKS